MNQKLLIKTVILTVLVMGYPGMAWGQDLDVNILADGDFESGSNGDGWILFTDQGLTSCGGTAFSITNTAAHGGAMALEFGPIGFGSWDTDCETAADNWGDWVCKLLTFPEEAVAITFSGWINVESFEAGIPVHATVLDNSDGVPEIGEEYIGGDPGWQWFEVVYELTEDARNSYKAAAPGIIPGGNFGVASDGYTGTVFLDDVSIVYNSILADADTDGDGLTDGEELELGTDPNNPDTDGDGSSDGAEVAVGSDPLDPGSDLPVAGLLGITLLAGACIVGGIAAVRRRKS